MDSIRIKNLRIPARHGVYEFEKEKDGTFELDLELYLPLLKAGKSDRLEDTINYEDICIASALQHENVMGIQFHPELSGPAGLTILKQFIAM